MIYTFTPTIRSNKFNFNVNNEKFGEINFKNLKNIYINLVRTERQFEFDISEFYDSESKLLLVHFEEKDAQNLEFIVMFLERFEKEKNLDNCQKKQKIVVILIHLSRKKEGYNKDIFVSNLSSFEQTFIDNLYGKNILITDIMKKNIIELYLNCKLIDIDKIFNDNLYSYFQRIDYSFQDETIKQKDHLDKIINKIRDNKELQKKIKNRIFNQIENDSKEKSNIFDSIFENYSFETHNDFISILSSELENKYLKYLGKFIINAERQSIFSSLINLPDNHKTFWDKLFEEFIFVDDVNDGIKSNKIKIWTKLSLPSINSINQIKKIFIIVFAFSSQSGNLLNNNSN